MAADQQNLSRVEVLVVFTLVFAAGLLQFGLQAVLGVSPTDFPWHVNAIPAVLRGEIYVPHPLFHWLTYLVAGLPLMRVSVAAALVCALALVAASVVQYRALIEVASDRPRRALWGALIVTFTAPLYVPFINSHIYLGQFSPNVYHNPTFIVMKPFALVAFVLGCRLIEGRRAGVFATIVCGVAVVLSMLAKPSFAIVFLPALWIAFLWSMRPGADREGWQARLTALIVVSLAAVAVLVPQAYHIFVMSDVGEVVRPGQNSQIAVDQFLRQWHTRTPSVTYSICAALAFPLTVLAARWRQMLGRVEGVTAWLMLLLGMAAYATLIDLVTPGVSNFGWSYMSGQLVVFLVALEELFRWSGEGGRDRLRSVAVTLLLLHLACGIYYYCKVALGYGYA